MIMRRPSSRLGATIIELAMCIVILAVALPPLMSSFIEASNQSILPVRESSASFLVVERMEAVIARRYRGTDGYSALTVPTVAEFPDESPVSGFSAYSRSVRVSYVNSDLSAAVSDQGYKLVTVTVTWDGGASQLVIERVFANFES
ncbi:hypothetical protein B7486_02525 [cyanobacterium TDX16]|nr:hypothetical protein B7486_02525 [cyanobacterium TDX16]